MKLRSHLIWGAALASALTSGMACGVVGGDQDCTVARAEGGDYVAILTPTDPASTPADGCGLYEIGADGVTPEPYFLFAVEKLGQTENDPSTTVAILPDALVDPSTGDAIITSVDASGNPQTTAVASGAFTSPKTAADPNADNLHTCTVPTMTAATDGTISYTFSNVVFLSEPGFQGAQVSASLTYDNGAGCSASFTLLALAPAHGCAADADCHWDTIADDPNCNTFTGLLSTMPAHCDTDIGICALGTQSATGFVSATFPATGGGYSCALAAANNGNGYPQ